ncbi:MAG: hypothetical protein Q4B67_09270 [Eubacteriales bacterium]|nr:hypothetical protein [Eubacteriales bacterium]
MHALLLAITVSSAVLGNSFKNIFSKHTLKTQSDTLSFNLFNNAVALLVIALFGGLGRVSGFTILVAIGMGVMNLLAGYFFTLTLTCGPMALSTLVQLSLSLLISALWGPVFWHESIALKQGIGIIMILLSMTLISNARVEGNISFKWLFLCFLAGLSNSTLGLFQKILTMSAYASEQMGFLFYAFIVSTVVNALWLIGRTRVKKEAVTCTYKGMTLVSAVVCGLSMAAQHIINLYLVGELPTVVFFPICTGLRILLIALVGIVIFKEKLSKRQLIGFIIGFSALFLVAGVI